MNEFETLGTLVRLRRQERKLTQDELADLAGISRGQIALIEGGAELFSGLSGEGCECT